MEQNQISDGLILKRTTTSENHFIEAQLKTMAKKTRNDSIER